MLTTKEVEVGVAGINGKWFDKKGYNIPRRINVNGINSAPRGTKIKVKVEDLPDGSGTKVNVKCDGCDKEIIGISWYSYLNYVRDDGMYYCQKCARNGYKKWLSFYDWCYDNLPKEEADKTMARWDYELNIDKNGNVISPKDIGFRSNGSNSKGHWFKCLDNSEHASELKNIISFTKNESRLNCNQCNTILSIYPKLVSCLIDQDDKNCSIKSGKTIPVRCPDCGFEKFIKVYTLTSHGICCRCGDKKPYPEKFMYKFLRQFKFDFITELNHTTFDWCNNYRYDNYINNINCIIETHGKQHYEKTNSSWHKLKETQENDKCKEMLAKENGIENYIVIDCRKSEMEWIKNSIMESKLPQLLNFKEEDINWVECHEHAMLFNTVKAACSLWNEGKNTSEIMFILNMGRSAIIRYLKQGVDLGWCNYNSKLETKNNLITMSKNNCKQVICLTTKEIFNSLIDAGLKYNIKPTRITACCSKNNKIKTAGIHPDTKKKLIWMYYDEYLINNRISGWYDNYINNFKYDNKTTKVICLTTNETFDSISEASRKYNICKTNISQCCGNRNNTKSAGKHPKTGEKMIWRYV